MVCIFVKELLSNLPLEKTPISFGTVYKNLISVFRITFFIGVLNTKTSFTYVSGIVTFLSPYAMLSFISNVTS